jgi:hypothetical protein
VDAKAEQVERTRRKTWSRVADPSLCPTRTIQVVFADSRKFAEEWTYRFLAAALADATGAGVE